MSKMNSFIDYASDILGDTDTGISTSEIISICNNLLLYVICIARQRV